MTERATLVIQCPRCGYVSAHPDDIRHGYCGHCHDWTSEGIDVNAPSGGTSTCPICDRTWTLSAADDCLLPACGCFGSDATEANPNRPCEPCGIAHARACEKAPHG